MSSTRAKQDIVTEGLDFLKLAKSLITLILSVYAKG
ncbi:hypothetical protein Calkro_1760 [Caldicellulosiruptor kronotskyensis 2002]|uniref:Uncharacterized protein n=1 Tax=Caldicellulosiruptor kronotskyensis (strain DSM 18902 / VKM B-2412 / 2002) TaxID=632348 RepID=E4SFT5_CALK2|nr:hypothetical protein Calkro_1760 [Caldicellulosiruptor kronotskyensis 2002]